MYTRYFSAYVCLRNPLLQKLKIILICQDISWHYMATVWKWRACRVFHACKDLLRTEKNYSSCIQRSVKLFPTWPSILWIRNKVWLLTGIIKTHQWWEGHNENQLISKTARADTQQQHPERLSMDTAQVSCLWHQWIRCLMRNVSLKCYSTRCSRAKAQEIATEQCKNKAGQNPSAEYRDLYT